MQISKRHIVAFTFAILAGFAALSTSCKKDDPDPVYNYLRGNLGFRDTLFIPRAVETDSWVVGRNEPMGKDIYEFTPYGVSHPLAGGTVGYYFKVTPGMETNDTTKWLDGSYKFDTKGSFRYHFGDTLKTYKIYGVSFGSDSYYGSTHTSYVTIVEPGLDGSVKTPHNDSDVFTDSRDGNEYVSVNIGGVEWMKPNLAWEGSGLGFRRYDVMSGVFGRFYTWSQAQNACPEGWSLPSDEDWTAAASTIKGVEAAPMMDWKNAAGGFIDRSMLFNNDEAMSFWTYTPKIKADNSTGLSIISSGYGSYESGLFDMSRSMAVLWTSSSSEDGSKGVYRYIRDGYADVYVGFADKDDFAANVRCIRK